MADLEAPEADIRDRASVGSVCGSSREHTCSCTSTRGQAELHSCAALSPGGSSRPAQVKFTRFPGSRSRQEPCRERWRKVSLTCLEIFRPGMEAARKIFTLFVLRPQRSGSRESSEKHKGLLPRHQFNGLVRDKRAPHITSLSRNRTGQTGISRSVPTVCGTLSCNPGIGGLGFQFAWNQNAFF